MSVTLATPSDLDDLVLLFSGYLDFYEVPAPHAKIREFLEARIGSGQSTVFIARSIDGLAVGFVQLYPFFASLALQASCWSATSTCCLPRVATVMAKR